jgi:hypothetical protein
MPSSQNIPANKVMDMVHFILSLSPADATEKVLHRRREIIAKRVSAPLPGVIPDETFKAAVAVPIVTAPLWWRDFEDPELRVAAIHDGKTMAVRMTWRDANANTYAVRAEEFEDMAAAQFFKGDNEPFVGMGAFDRAIDIWMWRAGWRARGDADHKLDDYPFDTPVYKSLVDKNKPLPDFVTARAAGNPNTQIDPKTGASALGARGFGSTTYRPAMSQHVVARASWKDGAWTLDLTRPMAVPADGGVSLASGDRVSAAFAIWFGEARDRNGQKLITVWQDLKVE